MAFWNYPQYPYYQQNQSYTQPSVEPMKWVDGEVGAKAFQMPPGWPPETPIALWDNSEKKIWLKSWNAMGMPNQMQEINYTIKERTNPALLPGNISGDTKYATKEDFEQLKEELHNLSQAMHSNNMSSMNNNMSNNMNNNNMNNNRGNNR